MTKVANMTELVIVSSFALVNLSAFVLMAFDKWLAVGHRFRISEATLIMAALLGGSLGTLAGMVTFRHKINKPKFRFLVPCILLIQIILFCGLVLSDLVNIAVH